MAHYNVGDKVKITGGHYKGEHGIITEIQKNNEFSVNIPKRHTLVNNVPMRWLTHDRRG